MMLILYETVTEQSSQRFQLVPSLSAMQGEPAASLT